MSKSITFVGNGKMALALAKGLCETHAIEVIGRSMAAMEQFEHILNTPIKKPSIRMRILQIKQSYCVLNPPT